MESVIEKDLILQRIKQFEEKVKRCEKQFSVEVLTGFLAEIGRRENARLVNGLVSYQNEDNFKFEREELRSCRETGPRPFVDSKTRLYVEWFVNLVKCLKTVYQTFVSEIYSPLLADLNEQLRMTRADDSLPMTSGSDSVSSDGGKKNQTRSSVSLSRIKDTPASVLNHGSGDGLLVSGNGASLPTVDNMVPVQGANMKTFLSASPRDICVRIFRDQSQNRVLSENFPTLTNEDDHIYPSAMIMHPAGINGDVYQETGFIPKAVERLMDEYEELQELYDFLKIIIISNRLTRLIISLDTLLDINWFRCHSIHPDSSRISSRFTKVQTLFRKRVDLEPNKEPLDILTLIPDIFNKLQKMAWVASKWHSMSNTKPASIEQRLRLVNKMENKLLKSFREINRKCELYEVKLELNVKELNMRLSREERSIELGITLSKLDSKKRFLLAKIESARLNKDRVLGLADKASVDQSPARKRLLEFTARAPVSQSQAKKLLERIRKSNVAYQSHLLSLANEISMIDFRRKLLEEDLNIEIDLKPSFVAWTNSCQESLEQLEAAVNEMKQRKADIAIGLKYVRNNKRYLLTLS